MDYFKLCPDTVLIDIFQFIPFKDLVQNCSLVCKRWSQLCCSKHVMKTKKVTFQFKTVDARYISKAIELGIYHIKFGLDVRIINPNLFSVKVSNLKKFSAIDVSNHIVEQILLYSPLITELKLEAMMLNNNIIKLIEANTKLENLKLKTVFWLKPFIQLSCKRLKKFTAKSMDTFVVEQVFSTCPNITDLTLTFDEDEFDASFIESLNFKKLEKLFISASDICAVEKILSSCPDIIDLTVICWIEKFGNLFTPKKTLAFKKLESLRIVNVDSNFLNHILMSCGNIKSIRLNDVEVDENICQLLMANSKLETLNLSEIVGFVNTPVNLNQGCEKLKEMEASDVDTGVLEFVLSCYDVKQLNLNFLTVNETICQLISGKTQLETLTLSRITGNVKVPIKSKHLTDRKTLKKFSATSVETGVLEYILSYYDIVHLDLQSLAVNETICHHSLCSA